MSKFLGYGIVWDAKKDAPLIEAKDGIFDTENTKIIKTLIDLGYTEIQDNPVVPPIEG